MKKIILSISVLFLANCSDVVEVTDISNKQVSLLAPAEGTSTTQTNINFNWNDLQEAENYRFQIAQPDFDNPIQIVMDSITTSSTIDATLTPNEYQWRVKALNSAYETNYTVRSFTVSE